MDDLDAIPGLMEPATAPTGTGTRRKCRHPRGYRLTSDPLNGLALDDGVTLCGRCYSVIDLRRARTGRTARSRGNRYELWFARRHGGRKVGPLGGPWDVEGLHCVTQIKTHLGVPPLWLAGPTTRPDATGPDQVRINGPLGWWAHTAPPRWEGIFRAMDAASRTPRLAEIYLPGQGRKPIDFIVYRGADDPDGNGQRHGFVAYPGHLHLDLYGRDEEVAA